MSFSPGREGSSIPGGALAERQQPADQLVGPPRPGRFRIGLAGGIMIVRS
jgi:hypothetical protein